MKNLLPRIFFASAFLTLNAFPAPLPVVNNVEWQPLSAQVKRLAEALNYQGAPITGADKQALDSLIANPGENAAARLQEILDPYCLLFVNINPESRVKVAQGAAAPVLD